MGSVADITAAPRELTLNGKKYLLSPLNMGHLGRLESWIEGLPLAMVKEQFDGLTSEERQHLLDRAYQDCRPGSIAIVSEQAEAVLNTARGVCRMLWHSLQSEMPDITVDEASGLLNVANFEEIYKVITDLSGMRDEDVADPLENRETEMPSPSP